jgi:hypothetical protein
MLPPAQTQTIGLITRRVFSTDWVQKEDSIEFYLKETMWCTYPKYFPLLLQRFRIQLCKGRWLPGQYMGLQQAVLPYKRHTHGVTK